MTVHTSTTILVPTGALGAGVSRAHVERGIALGVDAIACDAGSTDSGPSYLARGVSKVSRESIRHDLAILILDRDVEFPSYAFPFSPAEIERGQVYAFHLNHVVAVDDPLELTRLEWAEYTRARNKEAAHA